jgi:hypothetical protein
MLRKVMVIGLSALLFAPVCRMVAQDASTQDGGAARQGRDGGQFAGMQRVGGEVTGVSGATVSIKDEKGVVYQVVTTDNTRMMKGRPADSGGSASPTTIKVADLKAGDGLIAMGNLDAPNKTLHAAVVIATDAAVLKALKENLGKTYIAGKVTAIDIDNAKMTLMRTDGVSQTIGFDETTSFKRGRANMNMGGFGGGEGGGRRAGGAGTGNAAPAAESITLADVKVGDTVAGKGSVKSGVFVPGELTVATPGQGRRRGTGAPGAPAGETAPAASAGPGDR